MEIISTIKNHKKISLGVVVTLLVIVGVAGLIWSCPSAQFNRRCKDEQTCLYLSKRLTPKERKTFVAMSKYREETGKADFDTGILKYADLEDIVEVSLKIRAASADAVRQNILDHMLPQEKLSGNRECLRGVYLNELSNDELLFLQTPQAQNIDALKANPQLREMYIIATSKLMKCMNENIQKQFVAEVEGLRQVSSEPKK